MKRVSVNLICLVALLLAAHAGAQAQRKKSPSPAAAQLPVVVSEADATASAGAPESAGEVFKAADIYKTSLRQLLAARETEAAVAAEQLDKLKSLYADGLISRRELHETERALVETRHKVEEVRKQLAATDAVVAESLAEKETGAVEDFVGSAPAAKDLVKKVAYIRYKGTANWSVSEVGKIEKFFNARFKRALPVAAQGQSDLHTRWGYDHRNAIDVALHPDTAEGQALMTYLGQQGIPFMAFRRAVPGSATGPHIHIGKPSQKTSK